MACPYFEPVQPCSPHPGAGTAMRPLGDHWNGICQADPASPAPIEDSPRAPLCNLGYARGICARFPAGDGPDAVRFIIAAASENALRILYTIERDHHPYLHGALEFARGDETVTPSDPMLRRQAGAYVRSYRARLNA
jgi:hypothetical protein